MRRALLALALIVALGGALAYALFFPSPSERCRAVTRWGGPGQDSLALYHPMGVASYGNVLYVADTEHGAVKRYRRDGTLLSVWRGFGRPVGVAPTDSVVYIVDFLTDRVTALRTDGTVIRAWGRHGTAAGEFDAPSGIAVDREGNVYVADLYNHRVQKFTGGGRFLLEWGEPGRWSGRFRYPTGIAVTPRGEILVADGFNHRVQRFTADGRYLDKFGGTGLGIPGKWPGWFALAKDVAVDRAGNIYVTDAFNGRIQTFTPDGELLAVWGDERRGDDAVDYASGIAIDSLGYAYVGDFFRSEVWEIACPASERRQTGGTS